ncbi:MAG: fused MFS/spermidine synthase [Firmicutes bacterium]|nr:fused MFS/spermidine synthase [Bacillota bacterium]
MIKTLYQAKSAHQDLYVGERNGVRFLRFGGMHAGWQGACVVKHPERLYFPYQQAFSLHVAFRPTVKSFLAVGVGSGTAISHVHRRHPQAQILAVDLDGEVLDVAKRFFSVPTDDRVYYVEADARAYVPRMRSQFDLIFIDAFYQERTPKTFLSPVFLEAAASRMAPGGTFAMNVIMRTEGEHSDHFIRLYEALQSTIGPTWMLPIGVSPYSPRNIILFAQKSPVIVDSVAQVRARARTEIARYPAVYAPYARLLPLFLRRL